MKKYFFFVFLLGGIIVQAQPTIKANKVSTNKVSVVQNPEASVNNQNNSNISKTAIKQPEPVFATFSKMKFKLPFGKMEKEYMVEKVGHFYVLNDDIIVGNDFPKTLSYSSDDHDYRWQLAIIPYVVDPSIYSAGLNKIVFEAIAEYNGRTKLCLVRRTNQEDYVKIVFSTTIKGAGLSEVGQQGGEQQLYLSSTATKGTLMHEMLHAAGYYHEQSREDRDQFIKINKANIKAGLENNFQIEEGIPRSAYDYCSIMHYSATAFSKNKLPTIECLQNGMVVPCPPCLGNRQDFTDADIKGIDWFYSNSSRFPCEPLDETKYYPPPFPMIYPSASASAIAAFKHRAEIAMVEQYAGAFPNFYEARKGNDWVGGTIFIKKWYGSLQDIPLGELNNVSLDDFANRMRITQNYANRNGYVGGFPTYKHSVSGGITYCETVFLRKDAAEWRDVPVAELGNPPLDDIAARMRSAHDYATRNGFVGGYPTFYHADYGKGIVCGIVLIKKSAGEWRDVVTAAGPK